MEEKTIRDLLARVGAILTDSHIVYTSGKHGSTYVNKDAVYPHTRETSNLCRAIADRFRKSDVEVVVAPAVGGVILSQWVAHHLSETTNREVLGIYAEKEGEKFVITRGYDKLIAGKNVLVVEDVLTTGGSAKKVVEAVRALSGRVIGLGVLCNRGSIEPGDVGEVPVLFSLLRLDLEAWDPPDCPLCRKKVPINTEVGKGREFLAARGKEG